MKSSQYSVFDYQYQMVNLARTILRNIIGTLTADSSARTLGGHNGP